MRGHHQAATPAERENHRPAPRRSNSRAAFSHSASDDTGKPVSISVSPSFGQRMSENMRGKNESQVAVLRLAGFW